MGATNPYPNNLYRAQLAKVVDGDTVDLYIDVGFRFRGEWRVRLDGINTPENRGPEKMLGRFATDYVERTLKKIHTFYFRAREEDSFGRWLGTIFLTDGAHPDGLRSFNAQLVDFGYAVNWDGRGTRPGFDPEAPYPLFDPPDE